MEHETYETIDGKWWLFIDGKATRPLTDEEAAEVIWGTDEGAGKMRIEIILERDDSGALKVSSQWPPVHGYGEVLAEALQDYAAGIEKWAALVIKGAKQEGNIYAYNAQRELDSLCKWGFIETVEDIGEDKA